MYDKRDLRSLKNRQSSGGGRQSGSPSGSPINPNDVMGMMNDVKSGKLDLNNIAGMPEMMQKMQQFQGRSESDLMGELSRMAQSDKENFTPEKMNGLANQVAPMLNDEQKKKLQQIMSQLGNK